MIAEQQRVKIVCLGHGLEVELTGSVPEVDGRRETNEFSGESCQVLTSGRPVWEGGSSLSVCLLYFIQVNWRLPIRYATTIYNAHLTCLCFNVPCN